ncbi:neuroligin-4, Y-linked-like [Glandiceps talaboti]
MQHKIILVSLAVLCASHTILAYSSGFVSHTNVITNSTYGRLRGMRAVQTDGKLLDVYLGIPFAAPPVGDLRFAAPKQPDSWNFIRDALSFSPVCPQNSGYYTESEDCLYLDVYTPYANKSPTSSKLPVMVWIHGGCLEAGAGQEYDGSILAQNDVVVVTVNYRLGALGFLSTDDSVAAGNWGLLDNIMALQWVRDNIEYFGGDRNKVTIFGQSSGGNSVSLLLFSPLAKGLFHGAISQSGTAESHWGVYRSPYNPRDSADQLADSLGCSKISSVVMIECLRSKTWQRIASQTVTVPEDWCQWTPNVDGYVIRDDPSNLMSKGNFNKVPFIVGSVKDEFWYSQKTMTKALFDTRLSYLVNAMFDYTGNTDAIFDSIEYEYTEPTDPDNTEEIRNQWVAMYTDQEYTAPVDYHAKHHALLQENTYKYSFHYRSKFNPSPPYQGVTHGKDLAYEFGTPFLEPNRTCPWGCYNNWYDSQPYWTNADRDMSGLSMTLFTNFAKYSDPTPTPVNGITWDKFDNSTYAYLEFDDVTELKFNYKAREMLFWDDYLLTIINREQEVAEPIVITLPPEIFLMLPIEEQKAKDK